MAVQPPEDPNSNLYPQYQVGDEYFASAIKDVFLIVNSFGIIRIPDAPDYMLGAIYHGGMILPVINMRLKLGMMPGIKQNEDYTILVMDLGKNFNQTYKTHVGVLVDRVIALHAVSQSSIIPPRHNLFPTHPNLIQGMVHIKNFNLMIPDAENLFNKGELNDILNACNELQ